MSIIEFIDELLLLKKLLEAQNRDCNTVSILLARRTGNPSHITGVELVDDGTHQDNLDVVLS